VLAKAGAPLVVETLAGLAAGTIQPQPQNHSFATFAPLLDREDGRMDFAARTAHELKNRWRGFQPWPGAFTTLDGKKLIVHRMEVADEPSSAFRSRRLSRGTRPDSHRRPSPLRRCAGNTWLELLEVQLEGKKRLTGSRVPARNPLARGQRRQ
jgi:methionyl-tRNA formyltransferase